MLFFRVGLMASEVVSLLRYDWAFVVVKYSVVSTRIHTLHTKPLSQEITIT